MLDTLYKVKFNWPLFAVVAIFLYVFNPGLSLYSYFALLIFIHQVFLFFFAMNSVVPIRYLFGVLMCLQMFLGPALAYNGLDQYQYQYYRMVVPEAVYFGYAIPAVTCFIIGLHLFARKLEGENLDMAGIKRFAQQHQVLPYWLIGIGFMTSIVSAFFSSDWAFFLYLLGNLKFIGVFLLILSGKELKWLELTVVYGSIVVSSLSGGMFHDLLTWLMMLGAILAIKFKPNERFKLIFSLSFVIAVVVLQQLKGAYRTATGGGDEAGIETMQKVYEQKQEDNSLFNFLSMAGNNTRINQGFIITNIMRTVPAKVPFANGTELNLLLEAAIMPRFLAPDKLKAGDRALFTRYTGLNLRSGTSMGLSSVGDAYINFGIVGGCIFMFLLGLLYNFVLKQFYRFSKNMPVLLLFTTLVFYYPIRPDCELQTILGHLVKSCFLIFVIFFIWKKQFRVQPAES